MSGAMVLGMGRTAQVKRSVDRLAVNVHMGGGLGPVVSDVWNIGVGAYAGVGEVRSTALNAHHIG